MGNEIVYCGRCATRLLASDFEAGKAARYEDKPYCAPCLRDLAVTLPPEDAQRLLEQLAVKRTRDAAVPETPRRGTRKTSTSRIPVVKTERRTVSPDAARSSSLVPVAVGVALLLILGALAAVLPGSGSRTHREPEPLRPVPPVVEIPRPDPRPVRPPADPPPDLQPLRREESARRSIEKARAYGRANAADLPGRIAAFEEAAWECRDTSFAAEARREHEALRKQRADQVAAELAPLAQNAGRAATDSKFAEAIGLLQRERSRLAGADWSSAIDQKILQIRQQADRAFADLKPKVLQCRRRGEEKDVRAAVDRVASWGLEDLAADLTAALAAEPPPARPPDPEVRAYLDAWDAAFGLARLRDYAGALRGLEAAAAALRDPAAKAEAAADLETLRLLSAAAADVQQFLLRAPKGQRLLLEIESGGASVRIEGNVTRQGPTWVEVKTDAETLTVDMDDLTASALRDLLGKVPGRKPEADARLGVLFLLLEGEAVDLSVLPPGTLPPRIVSFGARVAADRARPDAAAKEGQARARFEAAERQFGDPATRLESFESYRSLLATCPDSTVVRRKRAVIAQRLDGEKEAGKEYVVYPEQMRAGGAFRPASYPKAATCWSSAADLPPDKENYVEFTFSARAGIEYRCWVYVGACCAETFAFDVQGTELGADPGSSNRIPVKNTILFLKKTHAAHGGRKEPSRFEWVALPPAKYAAGGPKTVRILSGQQGFSVEYAVVSASRTAAPGDAQLKELERNRPLVSSTGTADIGLVAWWTLDDAHGSVASDSSPNHLSGVLRNEPVWTSGKRRGALSFNGVGDYVDIPKSPKLFLPASFTIAAWLNPAVLPKSEWGMYAVSDYNAEGSLCTFSLRVMSNGAVQFFWQTDKEERSIAASSIHIPVGSWSHVAGVWDGMIRTIYVNGVPDGVCKDPQPRPDVGGNAAIGRPGAANLLYFNGRIDDVRLYSRALSSPEIKTLAGK
jgi:hypothetical protein